MYLFPFVYNNEWSTLFLTLPLLIGKVNMIVILFYFFLYLMRLILFESSLVMVFIYLPVLPLFSVLLYSLLIHFSLFSNQNFFEAINEN